MGVCDVVFESDSKIVDALNGIGEPPVAIDNIVVGIGNKLQDFRHVSISHVKKNVICPTYLLVQYDKNIDDYVTWIEENHNMGESTLGNDVLF